MAIVSADLRMLSAPLLPRCRFPEGEVVCAVSGGADSVALLLLAVAAGRVVTAVHVDHGLRVGSGAEASMVASIAASVGAAFEARTVEIGHGSNLEARARVARYRELPNDVCTGHTADDLAETMVLNLIRGAGIDGLAAMARPVPGGVQRPILALRRSETVALCAAAGVGVLSDPMNRDRQFRRVRVREEVLPLLDDVAKRDVGAILARQAGLFADDAALLDVLAETVDPHDARALRAAPLPLARRAIRRWLVAGGVGDGHPVSRAVVQRVLQVADGTAASNDLLDGWRVARTQQRLRLVSPPSPTKSQAKSQAMSQDAAPPSDG